MAGNTRGSTDCAEERIKLTVEIAEKTRLALRQLDLRSVAHQFALMKIEAHAPEFIRCDLLPFSPIRPYQQNLDPHLQLTHVDWFQQAIVGAGFEDSDPAAEVFKTSMLRSSTILLLLLRGSILAKVVSASSTATTLAPPPETDSISSNGVFCAPPPRFA